MDAQQHGVYIVLHSKEGRKFYDNIYGLSTDPPIDNKTGPIDQMREYVNKNFRIIALLGTKITVLLASQNLHMPIYMYMYFMTCIDYGVYRLSLNSSYVSASIKWNSLRPREPGTSLSCSSITGGLGDSSFPSGRTLKRHFSSRFHADSNNCPIRGIPEEMLKPIEPGWYKGQLRKQTWCLRKAILWQ